MTGNWEFTASSSTTAPFTKLTGYLNQVSASSGSNFATLDVLVQGTACYAQTESVPFKGSVDDGAVSFQSFEVNGEYLDVTGSASSDDASFAGTYTTYGSCSSASGTIQGARYAALTGNYGGTFPGSTPQTLQLALTQSASGTGQGTFLVSGTASVAGISCFTTGSLASDGTAYVSGSTASLQFATNDPNGAQLLLQGTFDVAAATLSITSASIAGGSCAGTLPNVQLTRQK